MNNIITRELSNSPIATQVGLASPVQYNGVVMKTIVAGDCNFLNDGSGIAQLGPKASFTIRRSITLRTFVNTAGMTEDEALNFVKDSFEVKDVVLRGEYAMTVDGSERCRHNNVGVLTTNKAQAKFSWDHKSDTVKIEVPAVESFVSLTAKLVKNSVKALARRNPEFLVFDKNRELRDDWELVLPPEAIKGLWEIYFEMACHWKQVSFIRDPRNPQPQEAKDLVQEFLAANRKLATFIYKMERGEFERAYSENKDDDRYTFRDAGDEGGVIEWTGFVVEGFITLAMENTPVYLGMGKSQLTPEMLVMQSLVCPELVEFRVSQKAYKQKAWHVQEFLKALNAKAAPTDAGVLNIDKADFSAIDITMSDAELFEALKATYPEGLVIKSGSIYSIYLDLVACEAIGPVDSDGNGYSYLKEICSFFRFLARRDVYVGDQDRRIQNFFNLTAKHLASAVCDAPKFIAKLLRPTSVQVTKVTTSSASCVKPWMMYVSADDPRVIDGVWNDGDLVINYRCPVLSGATYEIAIVDWVPVGLVTVNPLCWHANTKGDADGDQVFTEKVPKKLVDTVREAYSTVGYYGKDAYFALAGVESQV